MTGRGVCLSLALLGLGCSAVPHQTPYTTASAPAADRPPEAIVFVVNGAGNYQGLTQHFLTFVEQDRLPLHVHTFDWSHGYRRSIADQVDAPHARREAHRLAQEIRCYREQPGPPPLPIFIIAHSAGSFVTLVAAEELPPDSVECIVLLSPAVSTTYDVRPALRCARRGVEVFHSKRDTGHLGLPMLILGTSDRRRGPVSGRHGFEVPQTVCPEDVALYERLHQHPWHSGMKFTGHDGGHFGAYKPDFLRACVLPLLLLAHGRE